MRKALMLLVILFLWSGAGSALAGVCGGTTGLTCPEGQFCKRPPDTCGQDVEGVCTDIPLDCLPGHFSETVCGCDGVEYESRCHADLAGVSLERRGPCDGTCETVWGFPCNEGEVCVLERDGCVIDGGGFCQPRPTECPDTCRPICECGGVTHRTLCDAQMTRPIVYLDRLGACGESWGVRFRSASRFEWEPTPGATSYNVYLNGDLLSAETNGPMCEAAGLLSTTWDIPDAPPLGELWELEVTPVYPEGEGPMGIGTLCRQRSPGQECGP